MKPETLNNLQNNAPTNTIQIFYKQEYFVIYTNLNEISNFLGIKNECNSLKLNQLQYEKSLKFILFELNKNILEYLQCESQTNLFILNRQATPFNYDEYADILYSVNESYIVASIILDKKQNDNVLFSFYDPLEKVLFYGSFIDDEIFSNIFSFLSEINCQCVVYENEKIQKILFNMGINSKYVNTSQHILWQDGISPALKLLKEYLKFERDTLDLKISEYKLNKFMKIDCKTLSTLNIVDKNGFLERYIKVYTPQGKRYLYKLFRQPLMEKETIESRYNLIRFFSTCILLPKLLFSSYDLIKLTKRITKLKLDEIVILYKSICNAEKFLNILGTNFNTYKETVNENDVLEMIELDYLAPLSNLKKCFIPIIDEIEKFIDIENNKLISNEENTLIQEKENIMRKINEELEGLKSLNKKIKIEEKDGFYHFKIARNDYKNLKNNYFVEKHVLKGGVYFVNHSLECLSNELKEINIKILQESKILIDNLLLYISNYVSQLEIYNFIIGLIDVYFSFSKLLDYGFCIPKIIENKKNNNMSLKITDCFHPLVEGCVKSSIYLANKRFCIITGPNMGGKSTFLRAIALIQLFTQVGCPIPASSGTIPIVDGIFLRIGCNDQASQGLSTFMVEMNDIARICKNCTEKSLVIVDELGRGTSAIDGLSLAMSIKSFLIQTNCITFFATHFAELCDESETNTNNIVNKRVKVLLEDEITFLFEIEDGVCSTSFGIEVAKKVKFPKEVIENAIKYIKNQIN